MFKIDYAFKSDVIQSGLCEIYRDVSKTLYNTYVSNKYDRKVSSKLSLDEAVAISTYYETYFSKSWKEAEKINHANYERVNRLRGKVKILLSKPCLFLTHTFTDDVLKSTTEETRRRYVNRFLNQFNALFISNKDFGKQNGREHYHTLIQIDKIDYKLWTYGALNGLRVRISDTTSAECISKYISKLTNHAIKETTKRSCIMYSRKKIERNDISYAFLTAEEKKFVENF